MLRVSHPNMEEACILLRAWSLEPKGHFHREHDKGGKEREGGEERGGGAEKDVSFIPRYIDWSREQVPTCLHEVHRKILISIFPQELIADGEVLKHTQAWKKCALIGNACSKKCSCPFTTAAELHDNIDRQRAVRRRVSDEDVMEEEEVLGEERSESRGQGFHFQPAECNDFLVRFRSAGDEDEESAEEEEPDDIGYSMQNRLIDPYKYHRCCGITFMRRKDVVLHWETRHRDGVVPCDEGYEEEGKSARTRINMFGLGRPLVLREKGLKLSTTPADVLMNEQEGEGETGRQGTGGKNGKFLSSKMLERRVGPFAGLVSDRLPHFLFQEREEAPPGTVIR
eukprot:755310-Hanusia_phi.AAC.1